MPTVTDHAWLDVRLAQLRDKATNRLDPAAAAREITALAIVALYPLSGPLPAQQQRAFALLKQAHAALVKVAGHGLRSDPAFHRRTCWTCGPRGRLRRSGLWGRADMGLGLSSLAGSANRSLSGATAANGPVMSALPRRFW